MQPFLDSSPPMVEFQRYLHAAARSEAPVLVRGETGSGKEVMCRQLHALSRRAAKPLVAVNCAAIPQDLLESELFGYRKGAYTGALTDRKGRVEAADGGILLLDEIGDMPLSLQVKLLRFIEDGFVEPLGGAGDQIHVDVRIVAATHKNLEEMVSEHKFREDLYFRLNVIPLVVPPLRARAEQISPFIEYFALKHKPQGYSPISFTARSLSVLHAYDWPGNLRELSNFTLRMSAMFPGSEIDIFRLPPTLMSSSMLSTVQSQAEAEEQPSTGEIVFPPSSEADVLDFFQIGNATNNDQPKDANQIIEEALKNVEVLGSFPAEGVNAKKLLERFEMCLLRASLREAGQHTKAAKLLSMERTTFIQKLARYGISSRA